jgi:molybdopterin molybdotransferase
MTDSCHPQSGPRVLSLEQALDCILAHVAPVTGDEQILLKDCPGRVLCQNIYSPIDIPPDSQSSMDGYAFNSADLETDGVSRLTIVGTSWAGRPYTGTLKTAECVRIFTGALIPEKADSVVIQENVLRRAKSVEIPSRIRVRDNIRLRGNEHRQGALVLKKGKRLGPADIGMLASLGIAEIKVRRKPRVAFFSTGDELVSLDRQLQAGQIYDSNRYTLHGLLDAIGIEALDLGTVDDQDNVITDMLLEASRISDVVITSGGVSVGEADLVKPALEAIGQIEFWKIAVKPGKPLAFGQIDNAVFFGLPGNPVSVFVTFYQFVRPALLRMMGATIGKKVRLQARCASAITKVPGRLEFQRGTLKWTEHGKATVLPAGKQQSHNLSTMAASNCFIVLPAESDGAEEGDTVEVEPIDVPFHFN